MKSASEVFVGIDVSKSRLDICCLAGTQADMSACDNTPEACEELAKRLAKLNPVRIIVEATGGYEHHLVVALQDAGLPLVLVNPRQARDFAKAIGQTAKTDRIDARTLALLGQKLLPEVRALPEEETRELQGLLARRRQLIQMRTAESNRLAQTPYARVRRSIQDVLDVIQKQLDDLDDDIRRLVKRQPSWQGKIQLLDGVPGIGEDTAIMLVAEMPELGTLSRQKIASIAGVAPMNHDSGMFRGKRKIRGGRSEVRCGLYMVTLASLRFNPKIKAYYQRLVKAGKIKKVAVIACMHKLLTILNAMLRENKQWSPNMP